MLGNKPEAAVDVVVPVAGRDFGGEGGIPAANARDPHRELGAGKDFSGWIKDQAGRARLVEGAGFIKVENLSSPEKAGSNMARPRWTAVAGKL